MKPENKTKQELIDELRGLQERVSELENERHERNSGQAMGNFGERTDRSFPPTTHIQEAIFVVFDRKFEFVNDRFTELFGVSSEEVCSFNFDPMTLIAPESRRFIREQYREACHGAHAAKQFNYTGLSKDGLKIECETFLLFIPYKWGLAIQGTLRSTSMSRRIEEGLQRQRSHSNLPITLNAVPTGVLYADREHMFTQKNETLSKFDGMPIEQIPRTDYPVNPANSTAL